MNRKELVIIVVIIAILITINVINYIRRENFKKGYVALVEEKAVQISINDASANELEELPGIGPELADRIVEYRGENGKFRKLDDLKMVSGIGDKLLQKILPHIKL